MRILTPCTEHRCTSPAVLSGGNMRTSSCSYANVRTPWKKRKTAREGGHRCRGAPNSLRPRTQVRCCRPKLIFLGTAVSPGAPGRQGEGRGAPGSEAGTNVWTDTICHGDRRDCTLIVAQTTRPSPLCSSFSRSPPRPPSSQESRAGRRRRIPTGPG